MLVRYSIVELLMVFEVSAQREHTIVTTTMKKINRYGYMVNSAYITGLLYNGLFLRGKHFANTLWYISHLHKENFHE